MIMAASRPLFLLPRSSHHPQHKGNNSAAYDGTVGQVTYKTNVAKQTFNSKKLMSIIFVFLQNSLLKIHGKINRSGFVCPRSTILLMTKPNGLFVDTGPVGRHSTEWRQT